MGGVTTAVVEAEARLRAKDRITVPEPVVSALDARIDDTLIFAQEAASPRTRPATTSWAPSSPRPT